MVSLAPPHHLAQGATLPCPPDLHDRPPDPHEAHGPRASPPCLPRLPQGHVHCEHARCWEAVRPRTGHPAISPGTLGVLWPPPVLHAVPACPAGRPDVLGHGLRYPLPVLGESGPASLRALHLLDELAPARVVVDAALPSFAVPPDVLALLARLLIVVVGPEVGHVNPQSSHGDGPRRFSRRSGLSGSFREAHTWPLWTFARCSR